MEWIGELENKMCLDELQTSASIAGNTKRESEVLDSEIGNGLRQLLKENLKRSVPAEESEAQQERWRSYRASNCMFDPHKSQNKWRM